MSTCIQVTWGIKIAKFLIEIELFLQNQSGGKKMFGSQLIGHSELIEVNKTIPKLMK